MDLTDKVLAYQQGELGWFSLHIDFYAEHKRFVMALGRSEEEAHEFFYFNLERLKVIANQFRFSGFKFRTYLSRCMEWQWKSYLRKTQSEGKREIEAYVALSRISCVGEDWQPYQVERHSLYDRNDTELPSTVPGVRDIRAVSPSKRHLVIIALRNCLVMDDERCRLLAGHTGIACDWLIHLVDTLRQQISYALEKQTKVRDRYLAHVHGPKNSLEPHMAKSPLKKVYPLHKDIAAVLGIPKGTVDSIMWSSRRRLKKAPGLVPN